MATLMDALEAIADRVADNERRIAALDKKLVDNEKWMMSIGDMMDSGANSVARNERRIADLEGHMEAPAEAESPPRVPFAWKLDVDGKTATFECTHIDEELRKQGVLGEYNGFKVKSIAYPLPINTVIYLRGGNPTKDNDKSPRIFPTHAEAIAYRDRAQAALEHVRDEIAARWKAEAEPDAEADEQEAIAAFEERWTAIAGGAYKVQVRPRHHDHDCIGVYKHIITVMHKDHFDVVVAEAGMRSWFEDHVASLSIDEMDAIWKERQGEEIYPYWFLAGGATRLGASCPTPKRYQAQIFIGNMLVGESDVSPTDAFRKAHIEASIAWEKMQVAP